MPYHYGSSDTYFVPQNICPMCGSNNVRIGCQYQDCETCEDVESSECIACRSGWGGANYWQ